MGKALRFFLEEYVNQDEDFSLDENENEHLQEQSAYDELYNFREIDEIINSIIETAITYVSDSLNNNVKRQENKLI